MITAASLLDPTGDVTPAMFPDDSTDDLAARLTAYIARGTDKVASDTTGLDDDDEDLAVAAWAYYLAFSAAATRLASQPASADLQGLGSFSTSATQVKYFQEQARYAFQRFEVFATTPVTPSGNPLPSSSSLKNCVRF